MCGTHSFCIKKLFLACFGRISLHDFRKASGFKGLEKCENSVFWWEIIFVKIKCVPGVSKNRLWYIEVCFKAFFNEVWRYPKPNTSSKHPQHKIYPYLLKGVEVKG